MKELWKTIPGFERHEVSNHGRVRRNLILSGHRICKPQFDCNGNLQVQICYRSIKNNFRVARLVGKAFCKDFDPELRPVYKDGNRANCLPSNLRWVPVAQVTGHPYSKNPKTQAA